MGDHDDDKATRRWLSSLTTKSSGVAQSNLTGGSCPRQSGKKRGFLSSTTKRIGGGSPRRRR
ncbi:hypothetical protein F2Q69_00035869 [Brassica cretica]|uniref:Uncharacterized protein n=1 Tax=Brassica cretica TaxID=69181 RepID=A0A8S9SH36_BRACR|nr:hypothetical protein F2Q69_00035869 [Brassica cretica]